MEKRYITTLWGVPVRVGTRIVIKGLGPRLSSWAISDGRWAVTGVRPGGLGDAYIRLQRSQKGCWPQRAGFTEYKSVLEKAYKPQVRVLALEVPGHEMYNEYSLETGLYVARPREWEWIGEAPMREHGPERPPRPPKSGRRAGYGVHLEDG